MWPMLWSLCLVSLVTGQTLYYKPHTTVTCPDKHGSCPHGNTCCMSTSGTYGCCPLPKAVCCKDGNHCCPAGYQCDVKGKSCIKADNTNSWINLIQSTVEKGTLGNKSTPHSSQPQQPTHKGLIKKKMICPGAKVYCDRGQTCCFKDLGQFNCCPFVNGVCCPDRAHCCPLGFTCDLKLSKCTKEGGLSLPWGETHQSKKNEPEPENQGPSFFKTLLSLILDTFIDYEQDDDDDDDDRDKVKRMRMADAVRPQHREGRADSQQKPAATKARPAKASVSSKPVVSKVSMPAAHPKVAKAPSVPGKATMPPSPAKRPQPKKVLADPGKPGLPKKSVPAFSPATLGKQKPPAKKIVDVKILKTKVPGGAKMQPQSKVVQNQAKKMAQTLPQLKDHSKQQTKKATAETKKSVRPLVHPPPKMKVNIGVKKVMEPKTSTRIDAGKPKELPPITSSAKYKPKVKSVLKPISKPPGVKKPPQKPIKKDSQHPPKQKKPGDIHKPGAHPPKPPGFQSEGKVKLTGKAQVPLRQPQGKVKVGIHGKPLPELRQSKTTTGSKVKLTGAEKLQQQKLKVTKTVPKPGGAMGKAPGKPKAGVKPTVKKTPAIKPGTTGTVVKPGVKITTSTKHAVKPGAVPKPTVKPGAAVKLGQKPGVPLHVAGKSTGKPAVTKSATKPFLKPTGAKPNPKLPAKPTKPVKMPNQPLKPQVAGIGKKTVGPLSGGATVQTRKVKVRANTEKRPPVLKVIGNPELAQTFWLPRKTPQSQVPDRLDSLDVTTSQTPSKAGDGIVCPDQSSVCPVDNTCCQLSNGVYGCCPLKRAKCCPDKLHCCPSDEECDVEKGECIKRNRAWSLMQQSGSYAPQTKNIVCPDKSICPSGSTCCHITDEIYGCCPFSNAVCCSDDVHCCPRGYTCDSSAKTCKSSAKTIPWVSKIAAQKVAAPEDNQAITDNNVICPDKTSFCPDQTTCCLLESGQYGCCPLPNAVCCSDGEHCCPSGYICHVLNKTCQKTVSWEIHAPPKPASDANVQWVVCPDHVSQCPDGQTCCQLSQSRYGCCPLPNAVCCPDHVHCCPSGTVCNPSNQSCDSTVNSLRISWSDMNTQTASTLKTIATKQREQIRCADKTICPAGSTCCMMKSGSYGCCPYQKGVCCPDRIHCCPEGFQCDKSSLRCEKHDSSITLTSTMFTRFKPRQPASDPNAINTIKCPDGKEQCPEDNTCCKQTSGQYGCCPFRNAVCCSDGVHCCPEGYACDIQSGTCTQIIGWLQKIETVRTSVSRHIVCPDNKHWCPSNDTCCQLTSDEWGCCPLPEAVCCSDRRHCCPRGYKCDTENGTCQQQGRASIALLPVTTKAAITDKP